MVSHLDQAYTATRDRVEASRSREDWLEAAFHVVERLSELECRALLDEAHGKALVRTDADIVQLVATRLNEDVKWWTTKLTGDKWEAGRGE